LRPDLSPLELPLKTAEAAALADLVFELAPGKRLNDDVRGRLAQRASNLRLETVRPHFGSLEPDPVHASSFLLAVDAVRGDEVRPLLLRFADGSAPASGIFPKTLLIGRVRLANQREAAINAIDFGPGDEANIRQFAAQVNRAFMPKPSGPGGLIIAATGTEADFEAYRELQRTTGRNWAASAGGFAQSTWSAIRTGWREGFALQSPPLPLADAAQAEALGWQHAEATRFVFDGTGLRPGELLRAYEALFQFLSRARAGQTWRKFDVELRVATGDAAEVAAILDELKGRGLLPTCVRPEFGAVDSLVEAMRGAGVSVGADASWPEETLAVIVRAAAGRVQCAAAPGTDLRALAATLRG
jgi:hypothetical protein